LLRHQQLGHDSIYVNCIRDNLVYDGNYFRRQYKLTKVCILRIMDTLMLPMMSIFPLGNMGEVCKVCVTFKNAI
jgi:hypothetical protein